MVVLSVPPMGRNGHLDIPSFIKKIPNLGIRRILDPKDIEKVKLSKLVDKNGDVDELFERIKEGIFIIVENTQGDYLLEGSESMINIDIPFLKKENGKNENIENDIINTYYLKALSYFEESKINKTEEKYNLLIKAKTELNNIGPHYLKNNFEISKLYNEIIAEIEKKIK